MKTFTTILLLIGSQISRIDAAACFGVNIDALYWTVSEDVDWAFGTSFGPNSQTIEYKTLTFGSNPGFKAGIDYSNPCLGWDALINYTRFHTTTRQEAVGSITSAFLGSRATLLSDYESASIEWDISFNVLELSLGKNICLSPSLSFHPFAGIMGAWISQEGSSTWVNPIVDHLIRVNLTAHEDFTNSFGGAGATAGFDCRWNIKNAFSLVGRLSAAYLWGRWTLEDHFNDGSTFVRIVPGHHDFGAVAFQTFLGLEWMLGAVSVKIGYELQDWLNQYQIFDNATGGHNNDLILQGLTIKAKVGF